MSRYAELFSPLQVEAFTVAKELHEFRKSFEPLPAPNPESQQENVAYMKHYFDWANRLQAHWDCDFAPRVESLFLRMAKIGPVPVGQLAIKMRGDLREWDRVAVDLIAAALNTEMPDDVKLISRRVET